MCESIAFVLTLLHIGPTTIGVHYVENVGTAFPPSSFPTIPKPELQKKCVLVS